MKVKLHYDNKRFIFRLLGVDVGYAPFDTLEINTDGKPTPPEIIQDMLWLMTDYMPGEVLNLVGAKGVVLGPVRSFTHEVTLHGCGNPDYQQYADVAPRKVVRVCSVEEAQLATESYQRNYDMGGGNCAKDHGKVWLLPQTTSGKRKLVGYVLYGGRFETVEERKAFEKMIKEKYGNKTTA